MWMLITVTYGGTVSTNNFPTEALCRDGESVARTGRTVAELKAWKSAQEERRVEEAAAWRLSHPPRPPKDAQEQKMVEEVKKNGRLWGTFSSSSPYYTAGDDGLIYEWPGKGLMIQTGDGDRSGQIKFSKCIGPITEETKP